MEDRKGPGAWGLALLWLTLVCAHGSINLYLAALPLYLEQVGLDAPTVGLLIGLSPLAQVPAALLIGPTIDRLGGRTVLLFGSACFAAVALLFPLAGSAPGLIGALRLLQGLGMAAVMPAGYALVPRLVAPARIASAFGLAGTGLSLGFAAGPPVGLFVLERLGGPSLFLTAGALAGLGLVLALALPSGRPESSPGRGLALRRAWLPILIGQYLAVLHWGTVTAYLPLVAERAGANPALFFSADALLVLALRWPAGWLADRLDARLVLLAGLLVTLAGILALALPPADPQLILAGAATGLGAALLLPPSLAELSRRSAEGERGTALALSSVSFALAVASGSAIGALGIESLGFAGLMLAGGTACLGAVPVILTDPLLRPDRRPQPAWRGGTQS